WCAVSHYWQRSAWCVAGAVTCGLWRRITSPPPPALPANQLTGDSRDSDRNRALEWCRERESAKKFSNGESPLYAPFGRSYARAKWHCRRGPARVKRANCDVRETSISSVFLYAPRQCALAHAMTVSALGARVHRSPASKHKDLCRACAIHPSLSAVADFFATL